MGTTEKPSSRHRGLRKGRRQPRHMAFPCRLPHRRPGEPKHRFGPPGRVDAADPNGSPTGPIRLTAGADIVLIATPDDAIESACNQIAGAGAFNPDAAVLHCSGALSPPPCWPRAKEAGAAIGSMHTLQSFAQIQADTNPFCGDHRLGGRGS